MQLVTLKRCVHMKMQNTLSKNLLDYYPRRCPGPGGHSVARGLVPQSVARVFYPPRQAEDKPRRYGHAFDHVGAVDLGPLGSQKGCHCSHPLSLDGIG